MAGRPAGGSGPPPPPGGLRQLRSMTGFGRAAASLDPGPAVVVEARAQNHRHLDVFIRLPREYLVLEERVRARVRARARRGRVELAVAVGADGRSGAANPFVDTAVAARYHEALRELAERLGIPLGLDAGVLAGLPGVCGLAEAGGDVEADWPAIRQAVDEAMEGLDAVRLREGAALAAALEASFDALERLHGDVEAKVPAWARRREADARQRLAELLGQGEGALRPEAWAAVLERADVREELDRLRSHLAQARSAARGAEPCGRLLDFLAQEMAREWTTIAAKAGDAGIADATVRARVVVEQVREQVANVE